MFNAHALTDSTAAVPPHHDHQAPDANELRALATPLADMLAAHSGLSVQLAVPHARGARIVHHVFRPDNTLQQLETGRIRPAGSALAAALGTRRARCVYTVEEDQPDTASLATSLTDAEPRPWPVALALVGPRDALHPGTEAGRRRRTMLCETADALADALTGG
ncbi:hypothetical protein AB0K09_11005 [Streptomyces sp. NPDC049577]|uniref:hypothetical protein n=1 Tax=Streptomyces sp. NPDC049577 TaxID=3155153 RepID=UPI003433AEC0